MRNFTPSHSKRSMATQLHGPSGTSVGINGSRACAARFSWRAAHLDAESLSVIRFQANTSDLSPTVSSSLFLGVLDAALVAVSFLIFCGITICWPLYMTSSMMLSSYRKSTYGFAFLGTSRLIPGHPSGFWTNVIANCSSSYMASCRI